MNTADRNAYGISSDMKQMLAKQRIRKSATMFIEAILFILLLMFVVLPIAWGIITSLKDSREVLAYPPKIFNFTIALDSYKTVFNSGYLQSLINSVFYSATAIVLDLFLGMLAAYGLQRTHFRGRKLLFYIIIATIPLSTGSSSLLIPNYIYFMQLGLVDKIFTLPIIYAGYNIPMAIWIMRGGLENIPIEIEEAAAIDGCSKKYIVLRLIPHLNSPAMASAAIFTFISAWNEYIVSSVMINSSTLRPIQMAIRDYMGFFGVDWGALCTAASIAIVPVLIVFTFLSKYLISGLMQGSVKS